MFNPPLPGLVHVPEIDSYVSINLVELISQIRTELHDPDYRGRAHGTPGTRNKGCTGPMCAKNLRDRRRANFAASKAARGKTVLTYRRRTKFEEIDPIIDKWLAVQNQLTEQTV